MVFKVEVDIDITTEVSHWILNDLNLQMKGSLLRFRINVTLVLFLNGLLFNVS